MRREPNGNHLEIGLTWYEWSRFQKARYREPLSITFAFVATHNHFVLDRGGKVFNRSAPVIKLPPEAGEDDHLALLGPLNSSLACFWMRQNFHCKGAQGINEGGKSEHWEQFYEFTGTGLQPLPLPAGDAIDLARRLDELGRAYQNHLPAAITAEGTPSAETLATARSTAEALHRRMIAWQEELDWRCYRLYGVIDDDLEYHGTEPPELDLGQRAFEIVLARRGTATTWFERHRSTPITELPAHWPDDYRALVERRISLIESHRYIDLLERPEYKRRWNQPPWPERQQRALRDWLLARLEHQHLAAGEELVAAAALADRVQADTDFMAVAGLYSGAAAVDPRRLVAELVAAEAVPAMAAARYKAKGLEKHHAWQAVWDMQRREDAIDARTRLPAAHPDHLGSEQAAERKRAEVGGIPVPPRYASGDYRQSAFWSLRGKLDVPRERFFSLPGAERDGDSSQVIGWAGWDRPRRARAIAGYYLKMKESEGWPAERLLPLLVALAELIPWLKQWHNAIDPEFGERLGDYFDGFLAEELRALELSRSRLDEWQPPARRRGRGKH